MYGFGQEGIEAGLLADFCQAFLGRGDCQQCQSAVFRFCSELPAKVETADQRHLNVDDCQFKRGAVGVSRIKGSQGFPGIGQNNDLHAGAVEYVADDLQMIGIIVHHQDFLPFELDRFHSRERRRDCRLIQPAGEEEGAAPANCALHPDIALHGGSEFFGDGEPESGTAVFSGC